MPNITLNMKTQISYLAWPDNLSFLWRLAAVAPPRGPNIRCKITKQRGGAVM